MNLEQVSGRNLRNKVSYVHGDVLGEINSFKCLGSFIQIKKRRIEW